MPQCTTEGESPTGRANPVDLHTHSAVSDGTLAPAELVREAHRRGLRVLGLTDHDTVAGLPEASAEAARLGLALIPGVELSTDLGPHEVHLLGYFVDGASPDLIAALATLARQRQERVERIVARLRAAGAPVDLDRVREIAGAGTIGRPHIARALIERGCVASVSEAFDRFLAVGRPGFVPRQKVPPEAAVTLIRRAAGVPVLAHPLTTGDVEGVLHRLRAVGLAGMEVYYGEYDDATRTRLRAVADRWGLIPTGGSDFHGPGFKHGRDLGGPPVPWETVTRLRAAATPSPSVAMPGPG